MNIQIIGVKEALQKIDMKNKEIIDSVAASIRGSALMVEGEVKMSIAGRRAEPRSVNTGRFMQSVTVSHVGLLQAAVETNVEYAKFLEYGTSKLNPRYHFRNTAARNQGRVIENIKNSIR